MQPEAKLGSLAAVLMLLHMLWRSHLTLWVPCLLLQILITPGAAASRSSEPQIPSAQQNSPLIEAAAVRSQAAQSSSKPLKGKISWQPISQGIVPPKLLCSPTHLTEGDMELESQH